ncbi:MAG: hypothetical protein J5826_09070 [Bacteroidales bacterium]|nr:hypothetical protein [Bacteroidales bacterium]MBO4675447.1 hypothetical protein [Elusimicrobiaceae bacterium]
MAKTHRTIFEIPNSPLPKDFIAGVPDNFDNGGTLIHNARNQIRVQEVNGQKINIKKYCIPPIVNRILYSIGWRTPKAITACKNAQKILEKGFQTPRPYGYIIERKNKILTFSYFISEQLQGVCPVGYGKHTKEIINALAKFTADMHKKGLLHIDYTPNNILFAQKDGNYSFSLVDINRFRFYNRPIPMHTILTNLMKPFPEEEELIYFVKSYAEQSGLNPDIYKKVLRRRHIRNAYDKFKRALKKIPGAYLFLNKPLKK